MASLMIKKLGLSNFLLLFFLKIIEQDRHLLRRKLATTQAECETRLVELQADIRELQRTLSDKENIMRQTEKEKNALIVELTEQNQRLTTQIKEVSVIYLCTMYYYKYNKMYY